MPTFDMELMTQINLLFEPPTSVFRSDRNPETPSTCVCQPKSDTPDRHLNGSPCSSSGTLVFEEDSLAQVHKLADDQQLIQSSESDTRCNHILSPQPRRKSEFNPLAAPFVPSSSPTLTLVNTKRTWRELLPVGLSTTDPDRRRVSARVLAVSERWAYTALQKLAENFCWMSPDHYHHTTSWPGPPALFAQAVRDALISPPTKWEPSCFTFQLKRYVLEHFKSYWSSVDNPNAISSQREPDDGQYRFAFNLACFMADMFSLHLIDAPTMHESLGILIHEMAGVEHVFTIQTMVARAGARLWQEVGSHSAPQFIASFLERSSSLPDDASLTGLRTSIQEVIQAGNIIWMVNQWHAQRSEYPAPVATSIWA